MADFGTKFQEGLLAMIGKPKKELVPVDLEDLLKQKGLQEHFPPEVRFCVSFARVLCMILYFAQAWPAVTAVRELATKQAKRKKEGDQRPFVASDLKKCYLAVLSFSFALSFLLLLALAFALVDPVSLGGRLSGPLGLCRTLGSRTQKRLSLVILCLGTSEKITALS